MDQPLDGRSVLVTRPPGQERELVEKLRSLGADVLYQPLVTIAPPHSWEPVDTALANLKSFDWCAFTSVNGVDQLLARVSAERLHGLRIAAIGPATSRKLREQGLHVDLVPDDSRAEGLASALANANARRVLLIQPDRGREILAVSLAKFATVERIAVYRQVDVERLFPEVRSAMSAGEVDFVLLTSGHIARRLLTLIDAPSREFIQVGRMKLVTGSSVTAAIVRELGCPVAMVAAVPGDEALIDAVRMLAN